MPLVESGAQELGFGAIADGQAIERSGSNLAGFAKPIASLVVALLHPHMTASAVATNLANDTMNAVSDPNFRQMVDLRGRTKVRIMGRIGGSLHAQTLIRIQYHLGGDPAVASADGGWTLLADTAAGHTLDTMFYSAEISVPVGARVNDCLIRCCLYDGNGTADPTISACVLNFYP